MKPTLRANQIVIFFSKWHPRGVFCAREKKSKQTQRAGTEGHCWLLVTCVACLLCVGARVKHGTKRLNSVGDFCFCLWFYFLRCVSFLPCLVCPTTTPNKYLINYCARVCLALSCLLHHHIKQTMHYCVFTLSCLSHRHYTKRSINN